MFVLTSDPALGLDAVSRNKEGVDVPSEALSSDHSHNIGVGYAAPSYKKAELPIKGALESIYQVEFHKEVFQDSARAEVLLPFVTSQMVVLVATTERATWAMAVCFAALSGAGDKRQRIAFVPNLDGRTEKRLKRFWVHVLHVNALGLRKPAATITVDPKPVSAPPVLSLVNLAPSMGLAAAMPLANLG